MRTTTTALAALALTLWAQPAAAQTMERANPQRMLAIAKGFGPAELGTDGVGDPKITGSIGGSRYAIYFYGCEDNRDCRTITFRTAWSQKGVTASTINDWNENMRFGTAYLDSDDDPAIKMSVNVYGGITEDNFADTVDWWRIAMDRFREHISG